MASVVVATPTNTVITVVMAGWSGLEKETTMVKKAVNTILTIGSAGERFRDF